MGREQTQPITEEVARLREASNNVARLLEYGEPLASGDLETIGSVAGTLRARLQYYKPRGEACSA